MDIPLQIHFIGISKRSDIEERVRHAAQKLEKYFDRITSCRVAVEVPHRHHHQGNHYRVSVDLAVPGKTIVVSHEAHQDPAHEEAIVAIRDAFNAALRQLDEHTERLRSHA